MDHAHEIRVERLVPRAEHQRADRPEIDQRERVRIRSLANALFNATVREPDRARRLAVAERIAALHTPARTGARGARAASPGALQRDHRRTWFERPLRLNGPDGAREG